MRILQAISALDRGGAERVVLNFVRELRRLGHEVAVLAYLRGGAMVPDFINDGITVLAPDEKGDATAAIAAANAFDPQIIHIHRPGMASAADEAVLRALARPERRIVETSIFARVDASPGHDLIDVHLQLSNWCMWRWLKWGGERCRRKASAVVPNPVDVSRFFASSPEAVAAVRGRFGIPAGTSVVGRVGRPAEANWHVATIGAYAQLAAADERVHGLFVQPPPSCVSAIERLPPRLRQRVHQGPIVSTDAELRDLYSSIDVFIHAARAGESFGLVLCEAMLCGVPTVTASRPWKSNTQVEVVGHGVGGLVAASTRSLGNAAATMLADEALRQRFRTAGRQSIIDRFHVVPVTQRLMQVFELTLRHRGTALIGALAEAGLHATVNDASVEGLLNASVGKVDRVERALKWAVHRPSGYRLLDLAHAWRRSGPMALLGRRNA